MARRRGGKKRKRSKKTSAVRKSPNIVAEFKTKIQGKPAVIRVYRKNWKYPHQLIATVHVGTTQMYNKRPRLGKRKKRKRKR